MNLPIRPTPGQSLIVLSTQVDPVAILKNRGNWPCHTDTSGLYSTIKDQMGRPVMLVVVVAWGYDTDYTVYEAYVVGDMPVGAALVTVKNHGDTMSRQTAERLVPEFLREGLYYRD